MSPSFFDPAGRRIPSLDRFDFKKSPVRFYDFCHSLETHLFREGYRFAPFSDSLLPNYYTVAVSEYPLCFSLLYLARLLQEIGGCRELSFSRSVDETCAQIVLEGTAQDPDALAYALDICREDLTELAKHAHFTLRFEKTQGAARIVFSLPCYHAATFEVRVPDTENCFAKAEAEVHDIFSRL